MSWWNPFKRPRLKGRIECPSTQRVSLDDSAPTWSIPFAHVKILETFGFHLFPLVRLGLHSTTPGRIWHGCMTWFQVSGCCSRSESEHNNLGKKKGVTWFNSNNTSDAYLDWFARTKKLDGTMRFFKLMDFLFWRNSLWLAFGRRMFSGVWLRPRTCSDLGPQKLLVICYSHFGRINLTRECAAVLWLGRSILVKEMHVCNILFSSHYDVTNENYRTMVLHE